MFFIKKTKGKRPMLNDLRHFGQFLLSPEPEVVTKKIHYGLVRKSNIWENQKYTLNEKI